MNDRHRQQLARQIADTPGAVRRDRGGWSVTITPIGEGSDEAAPLRFRVTAPAPGLPPTCTCPTFRNAPQGRLVVCEHILAVGFAKTVTKSTNGE